MCFPALELFERTEVRVGVVEPNDKAEPDLAVAKMVKKRSAIGRRVAAPAIPANVVTIAPGASLRTVSLRLSVTNRFPAASNAIACGSKNRAMAPVPSADPGARAVPAIVATIPEGETIRSVLLTRSAT